MLIISYDISNDKIRTRFRKYLMKYGRRLQFSVYEIKHSDRVLKNITLEIQDQFEPSFTQSDSIFIFDLLHKKILRFGYAKKEESDLLFFD